MEVARQAGADVESASDLDEMVKAMNKANPPSLVEYKKEGKFYRVINREWRTDGAASGQAVQREG